MTQAAPDAPVSALAPRKGMTPAEIETAIAGILEEATLEEKVAMMSGQGFFGQYVASGRRWGADPYRAGGGVERLGVPPLHFTDGPRGVARGHSTCFPCTMARGATFDVDLERRVGEIMGIEARAQGCTLSGAVCVNLLRHPSWGRAQETYGEDPHHLGEMGAALATGIQTHNVVATVKHFALNSMENARFTVDVSCDDRTMREVYLPHFKRILDAGCGSVMSAYNMWNGEYCGQNRTLLTDILRVEWGFEGFVHSDWVMGLRHVHAATAGLDVENPEPIVFGANLVQAVKAGHVAAEVVDTACRRILSTQYRFACAEDPLPAYTRDMVARPSHVAVAREAAEKSAVLLTNAGVLPLDAEKTRKLAVLGRLAGMENTGDFGSSRVQPPHVVTALAGLSAKLGADAIVTGDERDLAAAAEAARAADAVVVVAGFTAKEEGEWIPDGGIDLGAAVNPVVSTLLNQQAGEKPKSAVSDEGDPRGDRGGDRTPLCLPDDQVALIKAAAATGTPVIVVLIAGSAVDVEAWIDDVQAYLLTFYSGMEGGSALAALLFGDVSPSGRLPFAVAREEAHYPFFDKAAKAIVYDMWHGQAKLDRDGVAPRFSFGHGLSYARFAFRGLAARKAGATIAVQVAVTNVSDRPADEVVLVHVAPPGKAAPRAPRSLKAFARVSLAAGQTRVVHLSIPIADLRWWDPAVRDWRLEAGDHVLTCGPVGEEPLRATIRL
jgi:beta-glucosidase